MKKNLIGILVIEFCIVYFIVLAIIINHFVKPYLDVKAVEALFNVWIGYFLPEPQERTTYIFATLSIPIVCGGAYIFLSKLLANGEKTISRKTYRLMNFFCLTAVLGLTFLGLKFSSFNYIGASSLVKAPILTFIVNCFIFYLVIILKPLTKKFPLPMARIKFIFYFSIGVVLITVIFLVSVFNDNSPYVPQTHFVAYFDSIAQVFLGKTLLVNFSPQYGIYGLLLLPIFRIIGLNVLNFTVVMGVFRLICYFALLLLIWQFSKNKLIGMLGFSTIVFYTILRVPVDISNDPYFQYSPHRMIFPILFIFLTWLFILNDRSKSQKWIYGLITLLAPISVLWNPDTGLVVIATWIIFLFYREFLFLNYKKMSSVIWKCAKHVLFISFGTFCVFLVFYYYTYVSSGFWPDIASASEYTKVFYFYGFFMLPMPPVHPWNMMILVYCVAIYLSVRLLIDSSGILGIRSSLSQDQSITQLIFVLAILGIGLFNYYVGRSADTNLIELSWPLFLLLIIFTDRLFSEFSSFVHGSIFTLKNRVFSVFRKDFKAFFLLGLLYFFCASFLSILISLPANLNVITDHWQDVKIGRTPVLISEVEYINTTSKPSDPILILSHFAPELYLYSNHSRPINGPGFAELILKKDVEYVNLFLAHPPKGAKIYWEPEFQDFRPSTFRNLRRVSLPNNDFIFLYEDNEK